MRTSLTPIAISFVLSIFLVSCTKDRIERGTNSSPSLVASMSELETPAHFDWRTTEERTFILSLGNHTPSSAKYRLEWYIEHPSTGADMRHVALIDKSNPFVGKVTLPKYAEKVFIKLITPNAQSSIQEFAAGPTTSHTFFTGKRSMKMSTISSITQIGGDIYGSTDDISGQSVSMSTDGTRMAVGAYGAWGGQIPRKFTGLIRIFEWNGSGWSQMGVDISGAGNDNRRQGHAGYTVSLSGDGTRVAMGYQWYGTSGATYKSGGVKLFEWDGSAWNQMGSDIVGEGQQDYASTGLSLSSDGLRVAIGAPGNDDGGNDAGHTRVYEWDGSDWNQIGADIDGQFHRSGDKAGTSVSLSSNGSILAVGSPWDNFMTGQTRVYQWNPSSLSWDQRGAWINGETRWTKSGESVSLSADGSILAVGAPENSGNGNNSGSARVYEWNGSNYIQIGADLDGETSNDQFGTRVSLSADGSRLAVSASWNDGGGSNAGHVRIFDWDGTAWSQIGSDVDGTEAESRSGTSLSMAGNGDFFAVGAPFDDGGGYLAGATRTFSVTGVIPGDSDGDGVADASDNYPNDDTRAYDSFNPSENSFGTAMFEDLFPHEADYDFNDVVVSWRQQLVSNADNKVVEAKIKVVKVARGGSLESGFGLKLGTVPSNKVASVTGCQLSGFASIGANGVENGQTYANIIFWDKISEAWPNTTGASMQNTISANPHSTEDTTEIVVTFTEPIEGTLLNNGGPYIWVNNERGREIHPAGSAPTDLVDPSYFGTGSDNSDPNDVTTMYKGNGNRPWALVIFEETPQTEEKVDFTEAYLKFSDWALSSGGSYNDWYKDESGYRGSDDKFYTK
ncbi:MAG: Uncharacterised protein [Flavobacteriia bacterium]|nr:MAG: Uncharacterised protein [Flavobacteriia bacterium]